jgi:hypothetical protein
MPLCKIDFVLYIGMAQNRNFPTNCESPVSKLYKICEQFMGYMEKSIQDLMQIRLYYESIYLNVGIAHQLFVKVSHVELQLDLWKYLWGTWKS